MTDEIVVRGRQGDSPAGRFERLAVTIEPADGDEPVSHPTELFRDTSKSILTGERQSGRADGCLDQAVPRLRARVHLLL